MILDSMAVFQATPGTPQDLGSQSIGSVISGSVIDLGALVNDLATRVGGNLGETDLTLHVYVDSEDFAGASLTLTVDIQTHSTTTTTSGTTLATSGSHAVTALVDGYKIWQTKLPIADYNRYLGLQYNVAGGNASAGKVRAFLTLTDELTAIAQK